jgi:hypothetical protein
MYWNLSTSVLKLSTVYWNLSTSIRKTVHKYTETVHKCTELSTNALSGWPQSSLWRHSGSRACFAHHYGRTMNALRQYVYSYFTYTSVLLCTSHCYNYADVVAIAVVASFFPPSLSLCTSYKPHNPLRDAKIFLCIRLFCSTNAAHREKNTT